MKLRILTILCCLGLYSAQAAKVTSTEAKNLGRAFLQSKGADASALSIDSIGSNGVNHIFYLNAPMNGGFVIISADDKAKAILGYSTTGTFTIQNAPVNITYWLSGYQSEISYAINYISTPDAETAQEWAALRGGVVKPSSGRVSAVAPLVESRWNQSPNYNALCPRDRSGELTVVGCVATAMSQVMRYWRYPTRGTGFHSYTHSTYGQQSANFATTTYNWAQMSLPELAGANSSIATLCYHVGVSVDMGYGTASSGGSGAYTTEATSPIPNCAEYALKNYFGYSSNLRGVSKASNSATGWVTLLKRELDARRPIMYDGSGTGGGHSFVCDGYDDSPSTLFHFNWGWGGSSDGYFATNALNPGSLGTGGGAGGFNSNQNVIIGIVPANGSGFAANPILKLGSPLTLSSASISYNGAISATGAVISTDSVAFNGQIMAAVFDGSTFMGGIDTVRATIAARGTFPSTRFSTAGNLRLIPGSFTVSLYYRKSDTSAWVPLADNGSNVNLQNLDIVNNNPIQLSNAFLPADSVYTSQLPCDIRVNLFNTTRSTFNGSATLSVYDLQGRFVSDIATITGLTIDPNSDMLSDITFSTQTLDVPPGTYLLELFYTNSNGVSLLAGNGLYRNPLLINVKGVLLEPDTYEPNNTFTQARALPLIGTVRNTRVASTTNANLHTGLDLDYYKVTVPGAGDTSTIIVKVYDEYNLNPLGEYTLDVLFSYSTNNGATFSETEDNEMSTPVYFYGNGGVMIIKVAPHNAGHSGTYKLEAKVISRRALSTQNAIAERTAFVFPNPSKGSVTLSAPMLTNGIITVMNASGQILSSQAQVSEQQVLNTETLATGIYFVKVQGAERTMNIKLVVE